MPRPKGDLESLTVTKEAAGMGEGSEATEGYGHTLSYRMKPSQYRRLRRHLASLEEKSGKRMTHQGFIEVAVEKLLTEQGG